MPKYSKVTVSLALIVGCFIFWVAYFVRPHYILPILMYHYFATDANANDKLNVTPKSFQRQMRFLKEQHYNVITLEAAVDLIRSKEKIPPKTIAITMDDGYKNNFTYAFSILKEYNLPATIFLIVNEVGRPENDRLSWQEIKEMQDSGLITFGSHTLSHPWLTELPSEESLKNEIYGSKKILEGRLGRSVNTFCYPGGFFNTKIKNMVKDSGYKLAVATSPGRSVLDGDIFALKRERISPAADNLIVFWAQASGYYTSITDWQRRNKK
ncbi:MAG: polysaccharide deacetylase family protein [Candidatus Omnitrophota bacterium]